MRGDKCDLHFHIYFCCAIILLLLFLSLAQKIYIYFEGPADTMQNGFTPLTENELK